MSGIRVNIKTGEIFQVNDGPVRRWESAVCEYCHHNFEKRKDLRTRFCSMSCAKTGQKGRLGKKHSEWSKAAMRLTLLKKHTDTTEIVPYMKIRNRIKRPHFVNDPYQWANEAYGKYKAMDAIPHHASGDYGLYKYGEWLANNQKY